MPARTRKAPPTTPTWRCGHDRTPTPTCPVCKAVRNAAYRAAKQPKRVRWIVAMTPVQLAEARALYNKAMGLVEDSTDTAQGALGL